MRQHIFLSPHLDDAIFSCGGLIHHLTTHGDSVLIITLMAGDPPNPVPNTPLVKALHARWQIGENPVISRRQEDRQAAAELGATVHHLTIPDCVYRTANSIPLYPNEQDLFGDVHPQDPARDTLNSVTLPQDATIYAPLGVGNHVDHQLVAQWILANSPQRLYFYEDYPYSANTQNLLNTISKFPKTVISDTISLTPKDYEAKCRAIAHYQSQLSTFWSNLDEMKQHVRQQLLTTGQGTLAERYWTS
ncbi:MAG: PIG-L family deacetylase [Phototrophicales bacterium]